jgi:hypothetical protein
VKASRSLKSEGPAAGLNNRWLVSGVCIFLAAITFAVSGRRCVTSLSTLTTTCMCMKNPSVTHGLNLKGVVWAFTHIVCAKLASADDDVPHAGLPIIRTEPLGHHLTNVLLHTATAIPLFLVLRRMTGFLWRSTFVAAVFAIHPLRVESVAWVAERKDVLSGVFFMLTLGGVGRDPRAGAERPPPTKENGESWPMPCYGSS